MHADLVALLFDILRGAAAAEDGPWPVPLAIVPSSPFTQDRISTSAPPSHQGRSTVPVAPSALPSWATRHQLGPACARHLAGV
eukprot:49963-Pyramimonas_sp.AAC.1